MRTHAFKTCHSKILTYGLIAAVIISAQIWYFTDERKQDRHSRYLPAVSCTRLLLGDRNEERKAVKLLRNYTNKDIPDDVYIKATKNCSSFIKKRKYMPRKVTQEESDFPLAFAILTYKDLDMTERLLRAIYRPHNYYCVHVDSSSPQTTKKAVESIAACFHNVFVASSLHNVEWGKVTVLYAVIQCMKDLLKYKNWKYFINLTGQEFPLKTNRELVKIMKAYNGANDIHSDVSRAQSFDYWTMFTWYDFHRHSNNRKSPPPENLRLAKGEAHVIVTRAFVDYVVNNDTAKKFLKWIEDTRVPDEFYFQSLNVNSELGVPGSHNGSYGMHTLVRYKLWVYDRTEYCGGVVVRGICNFGIRDLPGLTRAPQPFANKFTLKYEPLTYKCLEEWLDKKERSDVVKIRDSFYKGLPFVKGAHHKQIETS